MSQELWTYNCLDCVTTARVYTALVEEMAELEVDRFYNELVHPLTQAVFRMSKRGMMVDDVRLAEMQDSYAKKISEYTQAIRDLTGRPLLNPSSGDEMRKLLFTDMELRPVSYTKIGRKPSVDETTLKRLDLKHDHPLFKLLIKYREATKLKSTYLDNLYIPYNKRVRSRFMVHGTATGRLSSRDPNFQNIPYDLRQIYVSAPSKLLIEVDASQLELRLIAYASQCEKLIRAFEQGDDVHTLNAVAITGKPREAIDKDDREFAKRFIYCQNYGGGAKKISDILFTDAGIVRSVGQCEETLSKLRREYPEIYSWRERVYNETRRTGIITNEFGRKRITFVRGGDLPGVAYNTPIQSTAADYINLVFISLDKLGLGIVNQVHDSIVIECDEDEVSDTISTALAEFHRPVTLFGRTVVLPAEVKVGTRWGGLQPWVS